MSRAGIVLLLLSSSLLAACAAKRDSYDVPKIHLPEKFAQAPEVIDATISRLLLNEEAATTEKTPSNAKEASPNLGDANASQESASPTPTAPKSKSKTGRPGKKTLSDLLENPIPASPLSTALPEWWRMLGSEELNHLIDRALANNHDLRIASLRVAQLKARMEIAGADKLPTITLPVRSETYYPEWGIGNPNNTNRSRSTHQISLRADWRPDLWGETASLYESAEFQLMRATYQRDDMQRIVVARIAADYLEYLSLNDRLNATHETEKTLKEMFESVKARMEIGDATITELEQQRAAGYAVRATIPVLEQQRVVVQNRIAGFMGTVPEELTLSRQGMDTVAFPAVLPGLPSTLLLRRPDVRAVEARLLAADADIDVARARLLPPLDLTAEVGYGSLYLSRLFSSPTLFWNTIANLSVTLFDSGKRDKEVEFAKAIHEEMVETYIRVIYDAVREVDDSLSAIRHMGKQLEEQSVATESSFRAWNYSQEAYHAGAVDYLVMLDTERTYHRHLDDLYRYKMERYRGLVDLFSALGGGVHMGDKLPGEGNRPAPMPDEVDYGVVLDAVMAGLHPDINPAPLGYDNVPVALGHKGDEPTVRNPSEAIMPSSDDNHEIGHAFKNPLAVALTETQPSIGQTDGVDWDGESLHAGSELWLVELFGTFDRNAIFPAWRDLRARFPQLVEGRKLLPRRQDSADIDKADVGKMERQSWYRLFVSAFPTRLAAENACTTLRASTQHCGVVSSQSLTDNDPYNTSRTLNNSNVKPSPAANAAAQPAAEKAAVENVAPVMPAAMGNPATHKEEPSAATASPALAPELEIHRAVLDWATAWSTQNARDYLTAYTLDYNGANHNEWLKQRLELLSKPEAIQVDVSDIQIRMQDATHGNASFVQNYRTGNSLEKQPKTLRMILQNGHWLIAEETPEPALSRREIASPPPVAPDLRETNRFATGRIESTDQEFWLVELPPVHNQRAIAAAWQDLRNRFPGQMKIRTLLTRSESSVVGKAPEHRMFVAQFPEKIMAAEFCDMLHSAMQACSVLSSRSFSQRDALDASWSSNRSFANRQERAERP
ncbi:MAG: hypothetical protein A2061_02685 [Gallionellales bacterium GWA2_59_43]|nr:MAG: hypothetical protein A2061_02685 [Gallionellales bacterium GWA2_59_43]